jgi:hypothetical protein
MEKMTKKKETIPGVEYYTEGKDFSEQTRYRVTNLSTPEGYAEYQKLAFRPGENEFEMSIFSVENIAKRTLEGAGLPSDPSCCYTIPEGEKVTSWGGRCIGNLTALVEARGKLKRVDLEWFAAEILINIQSVRDHIVEGKTAEAAADGARAGELVGLAKAKGYFKHTGGETKGKKKNLPPVSALVRSIIRKDRGASAKELWETIPTDSVDGIKINGHKFYRNGGRLLALRKVDGCKDWRPVGKSLKYSAFRNRVTAARKTITR